jgi:hypothetical protein
MDDDRVVRLLEELRDLQRQHVANYQEALRNQAESIALQKEAVRRYRILAGGVLGTIAIIIFAVIVLLIRVMARM